MTINKNLEKAILIKCVNKHNDNKNFTFYFENNTYFFIANNIINDLCLFTRQFCKLLFKLKNSLIKIDLDSFLQTYSASQEKELIINIVVNNLYNFNQTSFTLKNNHKKIEPDILTKNNQLIKLVKKAIVIFHATYYSKYLQIAPTNYMGINDFVNFVKTKIKSYKTLKLEIIDQNKIKQLNMGLLDAVNKGSNEPTKLLIIKYLNNSKSADINGLVGKGIMFDAGGYDIKPFLGQLNMNQDMTGASSVFGAILAHAINNTKINIIAAIPLAKNLINENAMLIGDVYTGFNGKTVEINSTDAEGRLILADAISYLTKKYKIKKLFTISTLTGLTSICFGDLITPFWSTNYLTAQSISKAFNNAGMYSLQIPLLSEFTNYVNNSSSIADMANISMIDKACGNSYAAAFLKEFCNCNDFNHFDIAGTNEFKKFPVNPFVLFFFNLFNK